MQSKNYVYGNAIAFCINNNSVDSVVRNVWHFMSPSGGISFHSVELLVKIICPSY